MSDPGSYIPWLLLLVRTDNGAAPLSAQGGGLVIRTVPITSKAMRSLNKFEYSIIIVFNYNNFFDWYFISIY